MWKRRIIIAAALLAAAGSAYTGYWFWLAQRFERDVASWFDHQRALGYRISYASGKPSGYPLPIEVALSDVAIDPPVGMPPWRLRAEAVQLSLAPWQPMTLWIEHGMGTSEPSLQWNANGRSYTLSVDGIEAAIGLSDQATPPAVTIDARNVWLAEDGRRIANVNQLAGHVDLLFATLPTDSSVEFSLNAHQFSAQQIREVYSPRLHGRVVGTVPFRPLPEALAEWSNQGGYLDLTHVSAAASTAEFEGSATLALDGRLQPIGAGSVTVRDYIAGVDWAVDEGVMTPTLGAATKMWLSTSAEDDNGKLKVTLPVTIQDGFLSMGPLKLARVPHIAWK